ncbi:helix-turn-helix domain-containing protein [Halomarina salina]|uniref:Helix-turn-helix domain-containing protein n=1 Tax=Halomarina salina TaxID=1872699 RepID=A0ABD5RPN7_9EURY|nr:helix-turn-helix domain-containing protein [Halomarina salina]
MNENETADEDEAFEQKMEDRVKDRVDKLHAKLVDEFGEDTSDILDEEEARAYCVGARAHGRKYSPRCTDRRVIIVGNLAGGGIKLMTPKGNDPGNPQMTDFIHSSRVDDMGLWLGKALDAQVEDTFLSDQEERVLYHMDDFSGEYNARQLTAETMDISPHTVDDYRQRAEEKVERAQATIDVAERFGLTDDDD